MGTGHLPRAELSSGTMCSISHKGCQSLAPHLCSRKYQPQCLITQFWFFPSEPSCQPELSKLFLPVHLGDSQWLLELPFLPSSSLQPLKEVFIYRGNMACALYCPLDLESLFTDCTRGPNKQLHLGSQPSNKPLAGAAFDTVPNSIICPAAAKSI